MKKTVKKLVALFLCALVLASSAALFSQAADEKALKFRSDKTFTILNFSDIQDVYPLMELTKNYISDTLAKVEPDLVVLTGDNVYGPDLGSMEAVKVAINEFMSIFEEKGVPVAIVFGNHDSDGNREIAKDLQMQVYETYSCFVGEAGFVSNNRVGNYNLPILSFDESRYAFNLWFFDSGEYNDENDKKGYACVHKDQIEWYENACAELRLQNGGKNVPAISFQHIIVPEVFELVKMKNKAWTLPEGAVGTIGEEPCPPKYNNGQFAAFKRQGDVLATVSGHDHTNSFSMNYNGIGIINTQTVGFYSYNARNVGSRVFVLNEDDPENYQTYCLTYFDVYSLDDANAVERFNTYFENKEKPSNPTFAERIRNFFIMIFNWFKNLFTR